eukprot:1045140-Alexandrium_andersonii.AAC.1
MIQFLQPCQGRLPTTEQKFLLLQSHMRRIGHILEHSPNNLGQLLRGNRQARPGEYFTGAEESEETNPDAGGAGQDA